MHVEDLFKSDLLIHQLLVLVEDGEAFGQVSDLSIILAKHKDPISVHASTLPLAHNFSRVMPLNANLVDSSEESVQILQRHSLVELELLPRLLEKTLLCRVNLLG